MVILNDRNSDCKLSIDFQEIRFIIVDFLLFFIRFNVLISKINSIETNLLTNVWKYFRELSIR